MTIRRALAASISTATLALSLGLAAPALAQVGPVEGWQIEATDVVADPAITYGTLPNGMRYAIQPNDTPEGSASIRMHVDFGSIGETDEERGLAHFIEHMAFNGSTNVPEGEMIPLLERLGLAFGPDTNAYTSFDETVYMLDVPNATPEIMDQALFIMRETAGNLTFTNEAVQREREVIVNERRLRDSPGLRNIRDLFEFRMPGSNYNTRFPIGTDEVIREAPAERLRALYQRYYRPENTTLIVVGDFDVARIEAEIAERFGDWRGVGDAGSDLDFGTTNLDRELAFDAYVDPALAEGVSITQVGEFTDPADTMEERFRNELYSVAETIFDRRIERIANREDSPLLGGGFYTSRDDGVLDYTSLDLTTRDGRWADGLAIAEQELRRALDYGFTPGELETALVRRDSAYRRAAEQAGARTSAQLAGALVNQASEDYFLTAPAYQYQYFQAMRPRITLDAVNQRFRELWSRGEPQVRVTAKSLEGGVDAVAAAYGASTQVAVAEPEDVAEVMFAYDDWGTPGTITTDSMIDDLGIRTVTFANNVRLNVKQTDFEPGRVRFQVEMDGGQFAITDQNPSAAGLYLSIAGAEGGLGQHSYDEITELTAGKQVSTTLALADDKFVTTGVTTPEDFDLQMKLSAAYMTDPGLRPEADTRFNALLDAVWAQLQSQPLQVFGLRQGEQISNNRFVVFPSREQLAEVDRVKLLAAMQAAAQSGAIEIGVVGDIAPDEAIAAVARTFGALPARTAEFSDYSEMKQIEYLDLSGDDINDYTHQGQADQALVASTWHTTDDGDFREDMTLALLRGVLELKATETLREELAATYSPVVQASSSPTFEDYGLISLSTVIDPAIAGDVMPIIHRLAQELRDEPVSDDLLLRARQPVLERIRTSRENNGFWLGVTKDAQSEADRLDRVRTEAEIVRSITPAEIQAAARTYLTDARRADTRILSANAQ